MSIFVPMLCCSFAWLCGYLCNYYCNRDGYREKINRIELDRRDFDVQLVCDNEVLCTYNAQQVDEMASWWVRAHIDIQTNIENCSLTGRKSVVK